MTVKIVFQQPARQGRLSHLFFLSQEQVALLVDLRGIKPVFATVVFEYNAVYLDFGIDVPQLIVSSSMSATKIRVIVADDNDRVRKAIATILMNEPDIVLVGEAQTGAEAIKRTEALFPHVVLMDVSMPSMDGIEATQWISKGGTATKVLVVSQHDQEEYIKQVMDSGASGYVLKQSLVSELPEAIRTVYRGSQFFTKSLLKRIAHSYRPGSESTSA